MVKPIVHYTEVLTEPEVGGYAIVTPVDHPSNLVSNTKPVFTSDVVRIGKDGEFETQNTIYRKLSESVPGT